MSVNHCVNTVGGPLAGLPLAVVHPGPVRVELMHPINGDVIDRLAPPRRLYASHGHTSPA